MEKLMALQKYVRQLRPIQEKYVDHLEQVQDLVLLLVQQIVRLLMP